MKPIILAFLPMLFAHAPAFGATDCKVVEYVDRSEVICIGDEKVTAESSVPVAPSRATIADYIAQNRSHSSTQESNPGPSAPTPQQAALPSPTVSQPSTSPAAKPGSAAENLAKRRELATRNTRALMNNSSATAHPGQ